MPPCLNIYLSIHPAPCSPFLAHSIYTLYAAVAASLFRLGISSWLDRHRWMNFFFLISIHFIIHSGCAVLDVWGVGRVGSFWFPIFCSTMNDYLVLMRARMPPLREVLHRVSGFRFFEKNFLWAYSSLFWGGQVCRSGGFFFFFFFRFLFVNVYMPVFFFSGNFYRHSPSFN